MDFRKESPAFDFELCQNILQTACQSIAEGLFYEDIQPDEKTQA